MSLGLAIAMSSCQFLGQPSWFTELPVQFTSSLQASTMSNSVEFEVFKVGYTPLAGRFEPKPKAFIFPDNRAWTEFWQSSTRLNINGQPPAAPKVDFNRRMVIGLTSGSKPTGGFSVRINRIERVQPHQDSQWVIYYTERVPGPDCVLTQQPTTPATFVFTERADVTIELVGQKVTYNCSKSTGETSPLNRSGGVRLIPQS